MSPCETGERFMNGDSSVILATLIVYKLLLIGIGVWASRRAGSEGDFLIGGRGLGPWVAGLSYAATSSSAWVLLGFSGFVYSVGLSALWMLPGVWGGYVLVWVLLGRRLRREAAARNHVTFTDFLIADTNGVSRRLIALIASAMILFCFIFYIAAQLQAAGSAMNSFFGLDMAKAIVLGAGIVVLYSVLGGFWAVSVTDMVQGLVMAVIAVTAPVVAIAAAGGPGEIISGLAAENPEHLHVFGGQAGLIGIGAAIGAASIGLGTAGQPQLLARIMAVKDDASRRRGFLISLTWAVIVFSSMAALGLAGRVMASDLQGSETLLFYMIDAYFPAFVAGVALAALLSAIMSTVDSILLSSAAAVSHDLGVARLAPARAVTIARVVMILLSVFAVWLSLAAPAAIFDRVLFAWTALGAAFGPIVVARVLNWRPGAWAIIAAMLIGFSLAVGFNQFWPSGPGAILERLFPWAPALLVLFLGRRSEAANA